MVVNLLKYNRHWDKGYQYPYPQHRIFFDKLLSSLDTKQIFELVGLRRTGKTTLFFQLINHLINNQINPHAIWYFTFDEDTPPLEDLFRIFSKQTCLSIKTDKIYIFLDEIQKLSNFQNQLKVYYDLYPNLKFYISGSTSLFIKKKTQESLAGRISRKNLNPLMFQEYLYFNEKKYLLARPQMYFQELEDEFEHFLESQFVECVFIQNDTERKNYLISILRKIIFEDIPSIFSVQNPEILWRLVKLIGAKPGIYIDYCHLSQEIGISNKTISSYLYYLEEAFIVKKVYNFSKNLLTSEKKLKRYYLASPSFSWALTDFIKRGELVENLLISLNNYRFFWRDSYQHEVDFIDVKNDSIIPIEVKYKELVRDKELKSILIFARKFDTPEVRIFYKGWEQKTQLREQIRIIFQPLLLA